MLDGKPDLDRYVTDLLAFITSSLGHSIVVHHPNRTAALSHSGSLPQLWNDWWNSEWIDGMDINTVVRAFMTNDLTQDV